MKKITLLIILFVFSIGYSQTLLQGFESGGVNGAPFGGMPAPAIETGTGSNTSQVLKIVANPTQEPWQGINVFLSPSINLTVNKTMTIDVLSSTPMYFLVKVNTSGPESAASVFHNGDGTWQTLSFTFDTSLDNKAANPNGTYSGFVIHAYWEAGRTQFFTPTVVPRPARTFYVDNIREPALVAPPVNDVIGDVYINDGTFAAGDFSTAVGQDIATNNGSAAEPFATLDYALARSTQAPGDVIYIDAGTYSWSSTHTLATSGTLANPITIQGKGNETNITTTAASTTSAGLHFTTGNHWVVKDLNWTATAARAVWVAAATDITLDNCTINMTSTSTLQSIIIDTAGGELTIKNCTLTRSNTAFHMVEVVAGTSLTMQDNTSTFSALSAVGSATSVQIGTNASSVFIIERNKFINGGYGIGNVTGTVGAVDASSIIKNNFFNSFWGIVTTIVQGLKVYNNSFYTAGESIYGINAGSLTNWDIQNNILYTRSSTKACILSGSSTSHPAVMNNNHYYSPNSGAGQQTGGVLSFTAWQNAAGGPWETSGQGGSAASFDPLFVDAPNGDLHLLPGSPAIGAGADVGVTDDIDGDARPLSGTFDIGADEYTVTISSDATLSDLQVNGVTIPGFNPAVNNYTFAATSFTSVPVITATKNSLVATGPVITQATDFFENATVQITAEDGTTIQTYTVTIAVDGSDIIQDFEPAATYTGLQGVQSLTASVESNPAAPDGLSLKMVSSTGGQPWQEAFFRQTVAADYFDFTVNKTIQIDVYSDRAFHMLAKVQRTTLGSPASQVAASYTTPNQWQTLTFNFDGSVSNSTATGIYESISLFPNSDGTNGGFIAPQNFTVYADNISVSSVRTDRLVYTYQGGSWTPQNPVGVSISVDNMSIMDGTVSLNGAVEVNDLEIASGASLEAANGDVTVAGNVVNNGAVTGANQVVLNSATAAVSGTGTMTNLTVGASGVASVTGSQSITAQLDVVSGGTLNANGNITLVSNAMGTARVDEMDAGAIVGDVNVERYIPAGNRAYRFIGPTVSGQTVFNSWQEAGNNAVGLGVQVTGTAGTAGVVNTTSGHDETATGAASMFKWDAVGQAWATVANTNTEVLNAGAYYRLFVRGDRTTDLSNNAAVQTATKLRASGSLMQTSMVVTPGIANGEFFAVANPYQSKVSMATTASGTAADMYYWDSNLGMNGSYSTIGISSGVGTAGMATNVLDAGQAVFFVDASAAASVTIAQTNKVSGNNNAGVFSANTLQQTLRLKLYQTSRYNNNQSESDGLYIDFDTAHNLNVDSNDAVKLNGLNVNMAIEKPTGEWLAVERRTLPNTAETINLNISNYLTTNYTLVAAVDVLPGLTAYMKDNLNGNRTELVQGTSTPVHFTIDSTDAQSIEALRFEIVFELVTLGNEAIAFGDQLTIYPNPVDGDVMTIRMDGSSASSIEVAVFNTLGQQVMTKSFDQVTNSIQIDNLSRLSNGMYFVKISNDSQQATLKFIKE